MTTKTTRSGYTFIEISVVLIIIGLILAGVFIAKNLIRSAANRSQLAQFQEFSVAVNAFKLKYGGYPGDLTAADAIEYGFTTRAGTAGHGDGDNFIEGCGTYWEVGCEAALFWRDLSQAQMIKEGFSTATDADPTYTDNDTAALYYPRSKISPNRFVMIGLHPTDKSAWFVLVQRPQAVPATPFYAAENSLPTIDTNSMDVKIDDGLPFTGDFYGKIKPDATPAYTALMGPGFATATVCANANNTYYTRYTDDTYLACAPAIRMSPNR